MDNRSLHSAIGRVADYLGYVTLRGMLAIQTTVRSTQMVRIFGAQYRAAVESAGRKIESVLPEALRTEDGLLVTLMIRQPGEVLQCLLSWGRHVRVLEPDTLRDHLAEEAQTTVQNYQNVSSPIK